MLHNDRLPRATPSSCGVDPACIQAFVRELAEQALELHSFMFYKSGKVIAEGWWSPYSAHRQHMLHSTTKSFVACGIGLAVAEGLLSIDDKVVSLFPEYLGGEISENLSKMSVRHLLTMTTGHASGISGGEWRLIPTSWIAEFFKEPVVHEPGRHFIYSSATSYMLSAIIQKVSGQKTVDFLQSRMFGPMDIEGLRWDTGPDGVNSGGNGIRGTTADLLKLGILHLNEGQWHGMQVLPAEWVRAATSPQIRDVIVGAFNGKRYSAGDEPNDDGQIDRREGYGYQWWVGPKGSYSANGIFGQYCLVFPEQDAVFAFTGGIRPEEKRVHALIWKHLFPAMNGARTSTETVDDDGLSLELSTLSMPITHSDRTTPPGLPRNAEFVMDPNDENVERIALRISDDHFIIELHDHRGVHRIISGLDDWFESDTTMTGGNLHHSYEPESMRVLSRGHWIDDKSFQASWVFVETAFRDTVALRFEGDTLLYDRRVNTNSMSLQEDTKTGRLVRKL